MFVFYFGYAYVVMDISVLRVILLFFHFVKICESGFIFFSLSNFPKYLFCILLNSFYLYVLFFIFSNHCNCELCNRSSSILYESIGIESGSTTLSSSGFIFSRIFQNTYLGFIFSRIFQNKYFSNFQIRFFSSIFPIFPK